MEQQILLRPRVLEPVIKNCISLLALNSSRLACIWRRKLLGLKKFKQERKDLVSNKLISDLFRLRSSIKFSLLSSLCRIGLQWFESHLHHPGLRRKREGSRSYRTQGKGLPVASSFPRDPWLELLGSEVASESFWPNSLQRGSTEPSISPGTRLARWQHFPLFDC